MISRNPKNCMHKTKPPPSFYIFGASWHTHALCQFLDDDERATTTTTTTATTSNRRGAWCMDKVRRNTAIDGVLVLQRSCVNAALSIVSASASGKEERWKEERLSLIHI